MKKFNFSLERVRQWREKQVAIEEAKLQRLFAEKALIEQRRDLLEREGRDSAAALTQARTLDAGELQALDQFRQYVVAQRAVTAALIADCEKRIAEQRTNVMDAERRFQLLDKLKEKRWKTWNIELSRELEIQAGEVFLAKWSGDHR
jgi:hypothetical protein